MSILSGVISYPIPAYQNVPIQYEFYQPRGFVISGITRGPTTIVTTSTEHDYVIGQQVRLIIPPIYGTYQLNEVLGYVLSIPTTSSVEININSVNADAYISSPYIASITGITNSNPAVLTVSSPLSGASVMITDVSGMTEINNLVGQVLGITSTTVTVNIDTTTFGVYTSGGLATLYNVAQNQAQILAIGDIANGTTNSTGRVNTGTFIPGSFINIS